MSKTYHFIGIKGSGMSALALMLHQMGHKVQGSDVEKYYFTQRGLEQAGITILPFDEKNLDGDMEIIAGNAFRPDNNVEISYADQNGISYKRYHEFLGSFMRDFVSMGVAGAPRKNFNDRYVVSCLVSYHRHQLLDWRWDRSWFGQANICL